jgi:hypothetical protein
MSQYGNKIISNLADTIFFFTKVTEVTFWIFNQFFFCISQLFAEAGIFAYRNASLSVWTVKMFLKMHPVEPWEINLTTKVKVHEYW